MESSKVSEEFTDWEEIEFPSHNQSSSYFPPTEQLDLNVGMNDQDLPLQPEADGEPLEDSESPLLSPLPSQASETDLPHQRKIESDCEPPEIAESPLMSQLPSQGSETDLPHQQHTKSDSKLSVVMGEVKTVICTRWKRMITTLGSNFLCPTFVPAAALAVVILASMKIVQGRNRLLLLIREKDQRIKQLVHQIAHMNGILSARRRVPVLRIN